MCIVFAKYTLNLHTDLICAHLIYTTLRSNIIVNEYISRTGQIFDFSFSRNCVNNVHVHMVNASRCNDCPVEIFVSGLITFSTRIYIYI
jgi:hypothetical protein